MAHMLALSEPTQPEPGWTLVIQEHAEHRRGHQVWVYDPVAIPPGGNIQSKECRYCTHRHTSYTAAQRCGRSLLRRAALYLDDGGYPD